MAEISLHDGDPSLPARCPRRGRSHRHAGNRLRDLVAQASAYVVFLFAQNLTKSMQAEACAAWKHRHHSARNATDTGCRAARIAGGTPPTSPMNRANAIPARSKSGVTRNANAR